MNREDVRKLLDLLQEYMEINFPCNTIQPSGISRCSDCPYFKDKSCQNITLAHISILDKYYKKEV